MDMVENLQVCSKCQSSAGRNSIIIYYNINYMYNIYSNIILYISTSQECNKVQTKNQIVKIYWRYIKKKNAKDTDRNFSSGREWLHT